LGENLESTNPSNNHELTMLMNYFNDKKCLAINV
jgi:hypothetical protein